MNKVLHNVGLPNEVGQSLCPGKKCLPMSERLRQFTDEGFPLDTLAAGGYSYDLIDSVDCDLNVDFHIGFMEQAEIALHKAVEPAAKKVEEPKKVDDTSVTDNKPTE